MTGKCSSNIRLKRILKWTCGTGIKSDQHPCTNIITCLLGIYTFSRIQWSDNTDFYTQYDRASSALSTLYPKSSILAKYVCNSLHHWINNPIPTSMNIIGNVYWKVTRIKNRYVCQGKRILSFGLQKLKNIMDEESEGVTVGSCYMLDATQPIYPNCLWIIDIFITFTNN